MALEVLPINLIEDLGKIESCLRGEAPMLALNSDSTGLNG
jgi:hypothetical protein